ncbi:MAG: calcium/sodium antiporter [Methanomassiliicoccales archaeon]|nr:calcium/sodium antiporter [Methanomassiliicoccales archaeon]
MSHLEMDTLNNLIFLIAGFTAVYFGGRYLVDGAAKLASAIGVRPFIIGTTIVAFGTSAPEFFLGLVAGMRGVSTVSLGNVIGANVSNITFILALCAIISPIVIRFDMVRREGMVALLSTILFLLLAFDGQISIFDGSLMIILFPLAIIILFFLSRREKPSDAVSMEYKEICSPCPKPLMSALTLLVGLMILLIGAQISIDSAVNLAKAFGISDFLIGLTLVTLGTTLPEITVSIVAAFKKGTDIALGNSFGSIVFNTLVVAGMGGIFQSLPLSNMLLITGVIPLVLFILLVILLLRRHGGINRKYGAMLLILYGIFLAINFAF